MWYQSVKSSKRRPVLSPVLSCVGSGTRVRSRSAFSTELCSVWYQSVKSPYDIEARIESFLSSFRAYYLPRTQLVLLACPLLLSYPLLLALYQISTAPFVRY